MKRLLKIFFLLLLSQAIVLGSVALSRVKTFTQPDGTKFEGVLKGNSSFHWIESYGNIIKYSSQDKYYYKAIFNDNNELILTKEKPNFQKTSKIRSLNKIEHHLSEDKNTKIQNIQKNHRNSNFPR